MVKRRIVFGLLGILLLVTFAGVAADREVTYELRDRDGVGEIEVTTPLASYIFSEDRGAMRSVFLTFAPYGSDETELIPGARTWTDTLERAFIEGAEFPFSLTAEGFTEGMYDLEVQGDASELILVFRGSFDGLTITKEYVLRADALYTMDATITVENATGAPVALQMVGANRTMKEDQPTLTYLFDDEPGTDLLAKGSYFSFGGLGVMNKATVLFLTPGAGSPASPFLEFTPSGHQRYGVEWEAGEGSSTETYSLYSGRRRHLPMEAAGLAVLDQPGVGARLMIPVIRFLNMLYNATGNYGWAIILFTILTRLILFPLMRKQYRSMAKMQQLQPKLKRLQERFKDDRELMQKQVIELYKREGVNPMGGCLPMIIQLPIIFIIWRAILYASEQIHLSPGFLWIPDLSLHDPFFILVIVTTAVMILQQWLMPTTTSTETKGIQKYMGYFFPLFMAFLLWRFPAGLWLYYLLTTGAQVAQQAIVNWEMRRGDMAAGTAGGGDIELDEGDGNAQT